MTSYEHSSCCYNSTFFLFFKHPVCLVLFWAVCSQDHYKHGLKMGSGRWRNHKILVAVQFSVRKKMSHLKTTKLVSSNSPRLWTGCSQLTCADPIDWLLALRFSSLCGFSQIHFTIYKQMLHELSWLLSDWQVLLVSIISLNSNWRLPPLN